MGKYDGYITNHNEFMFIRSRLKGLEIMLVESKPKEDRTVIQQYFGRILLFFFGGDI